MTAREKKVKREDRSLSKDYFKKASDNYDQMLVAYQSENWNAAATLAVQCVISSADAICVYDKGVRSLSPDHLDVCALVAQLPRKEATQRAKQFRKVIARKNMVQYECRSVNRSDADDMVKVTVRVYQWVQECLTG